MTLGHFEITMTVNVPSVCLLGIYVTNVMPEHKQQLTKNDSDNKNDNSNE